MLGRAFDNWSKKRQAKEIEGYLEILKGMDSSEIGMVVAIATHMRHGLAKHEGYDLLDPIILMGTTPETVLHLGRLIREYQKAGEMTDAAAMMVWLHTLRAAARPELRMKGRELWGHLERGFPYVLENASYLEAMTGKAPELDGYDRYPKGLNPNVQ